MLIGDLDRFIDRQQKKCGSKGVGFLDACVDYAYAHAVFAWIACVWVDYVMIPFSVLKEKSLVVARCYHASVCHEKCVDELLFFARMSNADFLLFVAKN